MSGKVTSYRVGNRFMCCFEKEAGKLNVKNPFKFKYI